MIFKRHFRWLELGERKDHTVQSIGGGDNFYQTCELPSWVTITSMITENVWQIAFPLEVLNNISYPTCSSRTLHLHHQEVESRLPPS